MTIAEVSALLDGLRIGHAVIGALALSLYGVVRATDDVDVLTTDPRCLERAIWNVRPPDVTVDVRRGDADDPLAGVVRITPARGTRVDVVVGRSRWQDDVLARAPRMPLLGAAIPVALPDDLVLLKLYAGGPQDAWDIDQLLDAVPGLDASVSSRLAVLPAECRVLWQRIVDARSA